MALQVDREQRFLHDILRIDPALHDLSPGKAAHQAGRLPEEIGIGLFVAGDSGAQKPGKFDFPRPPFKPASFQFASARRLLQCARTDSVQFMPRSPITNFCRRRDVTLAPPGSNSRSARRKIDASTSERENTACLQDQA